MALLTPSSRSDQVTVLLFTCFRLFVLSAYRCLRLIPFGEGLMSVVRRPPRMPPMMLRAF